MMGPEADRIVAANRSYAEGFSGAGAVRPSRNLAIVACMDARLDIFALLGLEIGDAHVIRNAGGIVTDDVFRSLTLSQRALGTREIVLVHHTDCGLQGVVDDDFAAELEAATGVVPGWRAGGFADPHADVAVSIERLRSSPFLLHRDLISGFVYDVDTGRLDPVAAGD
jgi:carbonic anhydrase